MLAKFVENCLLCEGRHVWAGAECEESPPEHEGAAETMCNELMATSICRPPAPLQGDEVENLGVKLSPGRRGGVWCGVV